MDPPPQCGCEAVLNSENFERVMLYVCGAIIGLAQFTMTCLLKSRCTNVKCGWLNIQRQVVNDASVRSLTNQTAVQASAV